MVTKPINVEAQRIQKILEDTHSKLTETVISFGMNSKV